MCRSPPPQHSLIAKMNLRPRVQQVRSGRCVPCAEMHKPDSPKGYRQQDTWLPCHLHTAWSIGDGRCRPAWCRMTPPCIHVFSFRSACWSALVECATIGDILYLFRIPMMIASTCSSQYCSVYVGKLVGDDIAPFAWRSKCVLLPFR